MSSDYTVLETPRLRISVTEQSMRYELGLESRHLLTSTEDDTADSDLALRAVGDADQDLRIRSVIADELTPAQFADLIVALARVYGYQHEHSAENQRLRERLLAELLV